MGLSETFPNNNYETNLIPNFLVDDDDVTEEEFTSYMGNNERLKDSFTPDQLTKRSKMMFRGLDANKDNTLTEQDATAVFYRLDRNSK